MECKGPTNSWHLSSEMEQKCRKFGTDFDIVMCENQVHLLMLDAGKWLGDRSVVA